MKRFLICATLATLLAGCTSVSESIPTVKIEKRKSAKVQSAGFVMDEMPSEASMICENDEMRAKALDRDVDNDMARVMIVQDEESGSRVLHEVEVDCRDYFLRKSVYPSEPKVIRSSTRQMEEKQETRRRKKRNLTYVVQRGDTVWDIAREHCTTVKAISRLNGLGRGNLIDVGDRLELPDAECD